MRRCCFVGCVFCFALLCGPALHVTRGSRHLYNKEKSPRRQPGADVFAMSAEMSWCYVSVLFVGCVFVLLLLCGPALLVTRGKGHLYSKEKSPWRQPGADVFALSAEMYWWYVSVLFVGCVFCFAFVAWS